MAPAICAGMDTTTWLATKGHSAGWVASAQRILTITAACLALGSIAGSALAQSQGQPGQYDDARIKQGAEVSEPKFNSARSLQVDVPGYADSSESQAGAISAKLPTLLYLNRTGGIYTPANCAGDPGACNDSTTNITSVPKIAVEMPAWSVGDNDWSYVVDCVEEILGPFNVRVTDRDPGSQLHIESYIGGSPLQMQLPGNVAGVSPARTDCGIVEDSITFVFPEVLGGDLRRTCETIAQEFAHSIGLDHLYLCEDPMSYLSDCGPKRFQFADASCGEFGERECQCGNTPNGSQSQNSAKLLLDKLGRSEAPALWLSEPMNGAIVQPDGFSVTATVTRPPVSVEIFVDGILESTEIPKLDSSAAYQEFTFHAGTDLRPGTHHIQVNARYPDSDYSVTALVKVGSPSEESLVLGGCSSSGHDGTGPLGILLVVLALHLRKRTLLVLAAAATMSLGCQDLISGQENLQSACAMPNYSGVPQVGLIYNRSKASCTATLIGPDTAITAAHCVSLSENEPLIALFNLGGVYTQYVAIAVTIHPAYVAGDLGVSSADVAILRFNETVPLDPVPLSASTPNVGDRISVIAYDGWSPAVRQDPTRHSFDTHVASADPESDIFRYEDSIDSECMQARGGGLVVGTASDGSQYLLGIQGHQDEIVRLDNYGCWAACDPASHVPADLVPAACNCTPSEVSFCGECGIDENGTCLPRPDLHPCVTGLRCSAEALCEQEDTPPACAQVCTDVIGTSLCQGEVGFRQCPTNSEGLQRCQCAADGQVDASCISGCLL